MIYGGERMIIYTDNNDIRLVQSVASASTLISSLTGEIRQYILSKFPKDFFKSIYIDTAETIQSQNRNDKYNKNLNKLPYPTMGITPEISIDSPIEGMEKSPHLSSPNLFLRKDMKSFYKRILLDTERKYSLYYTSDYITANYNFRITTNKYIQNADLTYFMKSNFQQGFFQFLNDKYINTEIPKTYIKIISDIMGYNLDDSDDMTEMELYMIATGTQEDIVRKKINLMTGKTGFFVNEKSNLLTLFTDLESPGSVIRDGMSEGEYVLNFRVQVSTWLPNSFIFSIDKNKFLELDRSTIENSLSNISGEQDEGFYSLSISDVLLNRREALNLEMSDGSSNVFQEVHHMVFTYDVSTVASSIDLTDYMKDDLKQVHAYMISRNMTITDLMRVTMYNRSGILTNSQISIDYDELMLSILLTDAQDLSLSIYVNRLLFEAIKKAMANDEFFFNNRTLATIKIKTTDGSLRVPVYSFENVREYFSTELLKMLRVNTIYGIGYMAVKVDDPMDERDSYKICVGYNEEQPIILRLITI
jgi:hypothetical protein